MGIGHNRPQECRARTRSHVGLHNVRLTSVQSLYVVYVLFRSCMLRCSSLWFTCELQKMGVRYCSNEITLCGQRKSKMKLLTISAVVMLCLLLQCSFAGTFMSHFMCHSYSQIDQSMVCRLCGVTIINQSYSYSCYHDHDSFSIACTGRSWSASF